MGWGTDGTAARRAGWQLKGWCAWRLRASPGAWLVLIWGFGARGWRRRGRPVWRRYSGRS